MNQTVDETRHTRGLAKLAELDGQDGEKTVASMGELGTLPRRGQIRTMRDHAPSDSKPGEHRRRVVRRPRRSPRPVPACARYAVCRPEDDRVPQLETRVLLLPRACGRQHPAQPGRLPNRMDASPRNSRSSRRWHGFLLTPSMAAQPDPGWRLLQGASSARKYGHRTRCIRLPPIEAMFRNWGDAPSSNASTIKGCSRATSGWSATSAILATAPITSPSASSLMLRRGS